MMRHGGERVDKSACELEWRRRRRWRRVRCKWRGKANRAGQGKRSLAGGTHQASLDWARGSRLGHDHCWCHRLIRWHRLRGGPRRFGATGTCRRWRRRRAHLLALALHRVARASCAASKKCSPHAAHPMLFAFGASLWFASGDFLAAVIKLAKTSKHNSPKYQPSNGVRAIVRCCGVVRWEESALLGRDNSASCQVAGSGSLVTASRRPAAAARRLGVRLLVFVGWQRESAAAPTAPYWSAGRCRRSRRRTRRRV